MELNINSPCHYKNIYGVDDEIYWMCRDINKFFRDKTYSNLVDIIGISPIVAPIELIQAGDWKEEVHYKLKSHLIIVKKHIDYIKYVNGGIDEKKKLMIGNILKSINTVKSKGKIDYIQFEKDLLDFLGYTKEEIKKYI